MACLLFKFNCERLGEVFETIEAMTLLIAVDFR